jgi:hypothetical protein
MQTPTANIAATKVATRNMTKNRSVLELSELSLFVESRSVLHVFSLFQSSSLFSPSALAKMMQRLKITLQKYVSFGFILVLKFFSN